MDEQSKRLNQTRSEFIARILEEKLGVLMMDKAPKHPTVLWKLSAGGYLKFRSPRFQGKIIREKWIVEVASGDRSFEF